MERKHYGAIDGLRTIACIGIVMMHVRANSGYEVTGFAYNTVIPSFTNFTFLFMTISAFGMCCGYYEKMLNGQLDLSRFYGKRFQKILPFFSVLVLLDVVLSPSRQALYEAFADLTLLFGFLPDAGNISVIGVGWFLGLVFVFYLCFPFFCVLIQNKRRAWLAFAVSLIYTFVCEQYFNVGRQNILYSGCFFLAGGLIYLYRNELSNLNQWMVLAAVFVVAVLYYQTGGGVWQCLLVSIILLIYAIILRGGTANTHSILQNRLTKFISGISMEIYLSHMVMFRVVEKTGLNQMFGNGVLQYIVTVILVLAATIVFSVVMKKFINVSESKFSMLHTASARKG